MSMTIYSPPYGDPVHLAAVKNNVKQPSDITADDDLISAQVIPACGVVETDTGANVDRHRVMRATTFDLTSTGFPCSQYRCGESCAYRWFPHIHLPRVPVISIVSMTYVDSGGNLLTYDSSKYSVADAQLGIITLNYNETWPAVRYQPNAVTIRLIAGTAALVTAVAGTDVCTVYGRTFADGTPVQVLNSGGALPTGLAVNTTYFVRDSSGSTFKLAATSGGVAIDITGAGTGTNFITDDPERTRQFQQAILLLVGHWYANREAVVIAPGVALAKVQLAYDSLIGSLHA